MIRKQTASKIILLSKLTESLIATGCQNFKRIEWRILRIRSMNGSALSRYSHAENSGYKCPNAIDVEVNRSRNYRIWSFVQNMWQSPKRYPHLCQQPISGYRSQIVVKCKRTWWDRSRGTRVSRKEWMHCNINSMTILMLTWEEFLRKKSLSWSSLLSPDDS